MTDGSAPPAENPPNSSTTTPTDSRLTAKPDDLITLRADQLSGLLANTFREGWLGARRTPVPALTFDLKIDPETRALEAFARLL